MADPSILIVEDDADINQIVATHLTRHGYRCTQAFSGSEAKLLLTGSNEVPFDLVICDLMLPGMTGEQLVELIRERDPNAPIIVISARTTATDKIDLLKLGADDYLTKPFDLDELLARVEVQMRHRGLTSRKADGGSVAPDHATLSFGAWELDPTERTLQVAGEPVELTRIEFALLETMMRHPRRVFSKQELFESAWGEPYAADDNTLNVHISNIRAKLRATKTDCYIKTVWGMGFKLVEP